MSSRPLEAFEGQSPWKEKSKGIINWQVEIHSVLSRLGMMIISNNISKRNQLHLNILQ